MAPLTHARGEAVRFCPSAKANEVLFKASGAAPRPYRRRFAGGSAARLNRRAYAAPLALQILFVSPPLDFGGQRRYNSQRSSQRLHRYARTANAMKHILVFGFIIGVCLCVAPGSISGTEVPTEMHIYEKGNHGLDETARVLA